MPIALSAVLLKNIWDLITRKIEGGLPGPLGIAKEMAGQLDSKGSVDAGVAYLGGLLHDVGKPVVATVKAAGPQIADGRGKLQGLLGGVQVEPRPAGASLEVVDDECLYAPLPGTGDLGLGVCVCRGICRK